MKKDGGVSTGRNDVRPKNHIELLEYVFVVELKVPLSIHSVLQNQPMHFWRHIKPVHIVVPWAALGFYRGVELFRFEYRREQQIKALCKYRKPANFDYPLVKTVASGIFGVTIYLFPLFVPAVIAKEVLRIRRGCANNTKRSPGDEPPDYYWLM